MPLTIRIDSSNGVAVVTAEGMLSRSDAEAAVSELWKSPVWDRKAAVWDFHSARFDVTAEDTRAIAAFVLRNQPSPPPRRIAFVTVTDADYGMARMFEVFRDDAATAFRVFRDLDEALAWAGGSSPE